MSLPQRIHLIGIGGAGLSAIARVLAQRGHVVSGSDLRASPLTDDLNRLGVVTYVGHAAEQVRGVELVVISSAIPESNPEVQAAQAAGIAVVKRQQLLREMLAENRVVAVAGTHGKTTTAAMIAFILEQLGCSPGFVVGGVITQWGTNAQAGRGPYFVIEADEYDHAFYGLDPHWAVVTNIEMDHPDCYRDLDDLRAAFGVFLEHVPDTGAIVAGADSAQVQRLLAERGDAGPRVLTYGRGATAQYRVEGFGVNAWGGVDFNIMHDSALWGRFATHIPGEHNALNATAALLVASLVGLDLPAAGAALAEFRGTLRRMELKGERSGVTVLDDYAHHPTQVRATLAAVRQRYPQRRVWVLFQPHTYSRTHALLDELATSFADADELLLMPIYAARAHEVPSLTHAQVLAAIAHPRARLVSDLDAAVAYLLDHLSAGDVLITLGAGDDYLVGERVLQALPSRRLS